MFLSKLALYGTVFGTFFAVSAFSTVQISKQLNKVPIPNETIDEIDEDEDIPTRELSDTEKFIKEVTGFGNLKGNLNLTVNKGNFDLALRGDVYVSMETMDDVQVAANLNIETLGHNFAVEAIYLDNTVYATIEGNNVKLETSSLSDITTLFSSVGTPVELPDSFKNIDTNQLLSNLGAMTSEKGEEEITYTCNLIDGIPPIIFTTDLDYKLTSVSISGFDFEGFNINAYASINILGKGNNPIRIPDRNYIDLTNDINTMKNGLTNQITNLINKKEIGISNYNIEVLKRKSEIIDEEVVISNELVFNMTGDANISLPNLKDLSKCNVSLTGNMTNPNEGKQLNSNVDIKLYEGAVYFNYNDQLKLKYTVDDLKGLIEIIKTKISGNSTTNIAEVLDKVFPTNEDTTKSPIVDIVKSENYASILDYYRNTTIDPLTHEITVNLDGGLIGNDGALVSLSLATGNKGINRIDINGVYALGYVLNMSFELDSYKSFTMANEESYTNLGYINNIFDEVASLIHKNEFGLTLSGSVNLGKGDMTLSGNSYVSLGETNDYGVAGLTITKGKKEHNIKIDVNRIKPGKDANEKAKEAALHDSKVFFTYNENLKGSLNLESIKDTYMLIKRLAGENNALLTKLKGLLTKDSTTSTLSKIMKGEPEAILYDNSLKGFTYIENTDGKYYDIELNGNLIKNNSNDNASIHIYLNLNDDYSFKGIGLKGNLNEYKLDIKLDLLDLEDPNNSNKIDKTRLSTSDSYINFSDVDVLMEYLFNTGAKRDFIINGHLTVNIIGDINIPMSASIKVEKSNTGHDDVYAKVEIGPFKDLEGLAAANLFATRTFTMYIIQTETKNSNNEIVKNEMVHIDVERTALTAGDRHKTLTMEEFLEDPVYWICDYGLGFGIDSSSSTSSNIDYSKLLRNITYIPDDTNPSWTIVVNLSELVSILSNADVTITGSNDVAMTGDESNKVLSNLNVTTDVSFVHITLDASLDVKTGIDDSFKTTVAGKMK